MAHKNNDMPDKKTLAFFKTIRESLDQVELNYRNEAHAHEDKIKDLQQQLDDLQEAGFDGQEITTPIGSIKYETTGSLDLVQLMEAFGRLVQEQGPTEMLRHLEETFAV